MYNEQILTMNDLDSYPMSPEEEEKFVNEFIKKVVELTSESNTTTINE